MPTMYYCKDPSIYISLEGNHGRCQQPVSKHIVRNSLTSETRLAWVEGPGKEYQMSRTSLGNFDIRRPCEEGKKER